jgi:hypothetical protein
MSSIPIDYSNEKMDYLMKKMYLHKLPKEEARELMLLVEKKKQEISNKEYQDILSGVLDSLKLYMAGKINLYESSNEILKVSNIS